MLYGLLKTIIQRSASTEQYTDRPQNIKHLLTCRTPKPETPQTNRRQRLPPYDPHFNFALSLSSVSFLFSSLTLAVPFEFWHGLIL